MGGNEPGTQSLRHRRKYAALLALFPVVLIAVVEIGFRWLAPQPPRGFSDSLFEVRDGLKFLIPGSRGTQYSREFDVRIEGDERGYRRGLSRDPDSPAALRVFGDSFAFGWGVEAGETASALLAAGGMSLRNCAMIGDGLRDIRRRMGLELPGSNVGGILYLLYDNDLSEWRESEVLEQSLDEPLMLRIRKTVAGLHTLRAMGRFLDAHDLSRLVAAKTGYEEVLRSVLTRDLEIHRVGTRGDDSALAFLEDMLREAAESTTGPVQVVRIVPVYAAGGDRTRRALTLLGESASEFDMEALDRRLAVLCAGIGVGYSRFAPPGGSEERSWYFEYDMHLTPAGHRALFDFIETHTDVASGVSAR